MTFQEGIMIELFQLIGSDRKVKQSHYRPGVAQRAPGN